MSGFERYNRYNKARVSTPTRKRAFHAAVCARLLAIVPDAREIWLHGSRARGDARRGSDWDYVVFVETLDAARRMALHGRGLGGLADVGRVGGHEVHVQAERVDDTENFVRIVREEGFAVWRAGEGDVGATGTSMAEGAATATAARAS